MKIFDKKGRKSLWKPSKTYFQHKAKPWRPTGLQNTSPCLLWFAYRFGSVWDMALKLFSGASAYQITDGKSRRPPDNAYKKNSSTPNFTHSVSSSKHTQNSVYYLGPLFTDFSTYYESWFAYRFSKKFTIDFQSISTQRKCSNPDGKSHRATKNQNTRKYLTTKVAKAFENLQIHTFNSHWSPVDLLDNKLRHLACCDSLTDSDRCELWH